MPKTTAPLRLLAQDDEDLKVVSSALQDAIAKVGDIRFSPSDRTVTLALNRFRWEAGGGERVRAALQLGSVLSVQARRVRREPRDAVIEVLAVTFEPGEAPGGAVLLSLAGGGDFRIEVECLDVALADISEPWPTRRAPQHDLGAA